MAWVALLDCVLTPTAMVPTLLPQMARSGGRVACVVLSATLVVACRGDYNSADEGAFNSMRPFDLHAPVMVSFAPVAPTTDRLWMRTCDVPNSYDLVTDFYVSSRSDLSVDDLDLEDSWSGALWWTLQGAWHIRAARSVASSVDFPNPLRVTVDQYPELQTDPTFESEDAQGRVWSTSVEYSTKSGIFETEIKSSDGGHHALAGRYQWWDRYLRALDRPDGAWRELATSEEFDPRYCEDVMDVFEPLPEP